MDRIQQWQRLMLSVGQVQHDLLKAIVYQYVPYMGSIYASNYGACAAMSCWVSAVIGNPKWPKVCTSELTFLITG